MAERKTLELQIQQAPLDGRKTSSARGFHQNCRALTEGLVGRIILLTILDDYLK